uniref:Uncharacterized protein n=1 Tax=Esox lucius TaxID=8010 RepID=A0A6Q2YS95_ESOLU
VQTRRLKSYFYFKICCILEPREHSCNRSMLLILIPHVQLTAKCFVLIHLREKQNECPLIFM